MSPTSGPKLTCPAPVSQVSATGGAATVVYTLPTVSGGVPPLVGPTCTPPTGSTFPPGINTVACTVTDSQAHSDLCTFTVTVTIPPRLAVTRFLAFGDSITWGEDGQYAASNGFRARSIHPAVQLVGETYPDDLRADLVARYTLQSPTVYNDGNPGENALGAVNSGETRFAMIGAGSYDVALLMEGANDLGNVAAGTVTYADVAGAMGQMIDHARAVGMRPFLATIPPENPNSLCVPSCRGGEAAIVPTYNAQLRSLATTKGVPLVDVEAAFNGDLTLIGPDGLHPTAAGYKVIADTFFAAIEKNLEVGAATTTSATPPVRSPSTSSIRRR